MNFLYSILCFAMLSLATAAQAQSKDPSDPSAPVAPVIYHSAFTDYRGYQDPDIASWKQSNQEVLQGSGHASHAGHALGNDSDVTPPSMPGHPGMHHK